MSRVEQELINSSRAHEFIIGFSGVLVARSFCRSLFVLLSFFICHCIVCPSSIWGFWLPFWHLQTFLIRFIVLGVKSNTQLSIWTDMNCNPLQETICFGVVVGSQLQGRIIRRYPYCPHLSCDNIYCIYSTCMWFSFRWTMSSGERIMQSNSIIWLLVYFGNYI